MVLLLKRLPDAVRSGDRVLLVRGTAAANPETNIAPSRRLRSRCISKRVGCSGRRASTEIRSPAPAPLKSGRIRERPGRGTKPSPCADVGSKLRSPVGIGAPRVDEDNPWRCGMGLCGLTSAQARLAGWRLTELFVPASEYILADNTGQPRRCYGFLVWNVGYQRACHLKRRYLSEPAAWD